MLLVCIYLLRLKFVQVHFLGNDPGKAITFAGVFLLLASFATMLIKSNKVDVEIDVTVNMSGAH